MYSHSACSKNFIVNFVFDESSGFISYDGSGGRKANFEAIRCGHGGQQNKQHKSLKLIIKKRREIRRDKIRLN